MSSKILKIFLYLVLALTATKAVAQGQSEWQFHGRMLIPVAAGEAITMQGKIYIFGGYSDSTGVPIRAIQEFDPNAPKGQQWRIVGRMLAARSNFVARLYQGAVYIVGGETGMDRESVKSMEVWQPSKGSALVDEGESMSRIGATGEFWNGIFIIIGGYYGRGIDGLPFYVVGFDVLQGGERFKIPAIAAFSPYNHASVFLNDSIYIFGGVRVGVSNRIYKIDLANLAVGRIYPDLDVPRASFAAIPVSADTAWLIGGYNEEHGALASTSKFVVTSLGYEHVPAPELNVERKELMAAMLDDAIYVFGGRNKHNEVVGSVERISLSEANTAVQEKSVVRSYMLRQNYPNPFNPTTTIAFLLPTLQHARLAVFAANGALVKTLLDDSLPPGEHKVVWDGRDADGVVAPSGVYFYKLTTEENVETRKMLLVK